ncbi:MAG: hypothetical protein ACR2RB_12605 [Gammaproteobacteria bacterium]
MTPSQIADWNARALPTIFTQLNATNLMLLVVAAVVLFGWIMLGRTGAKELFPVLQARLVASTGLGALLLRWCVAIMIGMAALGLSPRVGTELLEASTLIAPDLELRLPAGDWAWIAWVEGGLALALALGIYVRLAAAILTGVCVLGLFLFDLAMLQYAGIAGGAAIYLLMRGGGAYTLPLPTHFKLARVQRWLERQPRERAQFLLRVLVGANLIYLGIAYKYLQANLGLALIVLHDVPTFGMEPATFVFGMALVETLAGALIVAGVLMRPLSVILFACFVFLSVTLSEPVISHVIFYGILATFVIGGGGRWRLPVATDEPGRVVILGGGFAGRACRHGA